MARSILEIPQNPLKKVIARLQTVFLFVICLLLTPVLFLIFTPVYIFRYFICNLAPFVRPDLGKMLATRSALFAADDIYNRPLCTIAGKFVTEGTIDVILAKQMILEHWINKKSADGCAKYGEMTHYVSYWFGFPFWKKELNFKLGDHVKLFQPEGIPVTGSELTKYINELELKPFDERKSPWELIIFSNLLCEEMNERKSMSAAVYRFHHSLSDGFGILQMALKLSRPMRSGDSESLELRRLTPKIRSGIKAFCEEAYLLLRSPYDLIKYNYEIVDPIKSDSWHVPEKELEKAWTITGTEKPISCDLIKEVKNSYCVSFNAVLMAAIAGSIRNFMLTHPTKAVPDFIHAGIPFPLMSHPGKLRNVWTATTLRLPVGENSPKKRLLFIEKQLQKIKKSPSPLAIFLFVPVFGGLFTCFLKPLAKIKSVGVLISNMPGPSGPLYFLERRLLSIDFHLGLGPGNSGFGFTSLSYDGIINLGATVDNGLISDFKHAHALTNNVNEQILILKESHQDVQV